MQHLLRSETAPRGEPVEIPKTGMWGKVVSIDGGDVVVSLTDFDDGRSDFGPVPTIGDTPVVDDRAFLHFDNRDRPAYAVIFAS